MDLAMRWHRLLRAAAFLGGIAVGLGSAIFIFSNVSPIDVHWRIPSSSGYLLNWTTGAVSVWLIAVVPLVIGVVAGYFYHLPARMHHFREHMRHLQRVHELEHEMRELRSSLDNVLMMPEDGTLAVPAVLLPPREHSPGDAVEARSDPRLPDEPPAAELLAAVPVESAPRRPTKAAGRPKAKPPKAKPPEPRRKLLGGLKAELAEIKLPAAMPAAATPRPRRNGGSSSANGRGGRAKSAKPRTDSAG